MNILIDGDACPVIGITEQVAKSQHIPVTIIVDYNHRIHSDYSEVITVEQGNDSADFELIGRVLPQDIVITQDYGVASLALAKGAYALHQSGKEYTLENIDLLLFERHLSKKQRTSGGKKHLKPIPKRTDKDDTYFKEQLIKLCMR
ncbi:MAG: YaiI/YqxD family protein [Lachnospiraceae bacterium]